MSDDANAVREVVTNVARRGPLADMIRSVEVEPAADIDDSPFLRILLTVDMPDRDVDSELENLLERIEEAVSAVDDRYASVRFLDAA